MLKNIKIKSVKFKKTIFVTFSSLVFSMLYYISVFAATPIPQKSGAAGEQPKIITGTVDLLTSATGWLALLIPPGAGLFLGYHAWQKSLTDDHAVIAEKNKMMKNVLIGAVIAETATGLARVILGFYS